jgi:dihydrofolate reductase
VRELVYYVATTLDGYIAREDGSFVDFPWDEDFIAALTELYPETMPAPMRPDATRDENRYFDAVLMGHRTYEIGLEQGLISPYPTLDQFVFSRTMKESPDADVTLISSSAVEFVQGLKEGPGRAIWLCGGGELASELFEARLVDRLVLKVNPLVFGVGISLFRRRLAAERLELVGQRVFDSGHLIIEYRVTSPTSPER